MSVNSPSAAGAEPRRRPRQARSRATVDRILDAAARIFDERGYHGSTTNHVAEAAGVSVGSLYQYFPNKDALLVGLAERHVDEAMPRLRAMVDRLDAEAPPAAVLCRAWVEELVDLNRSDRLHRLLWRAPRTDELLGRFARLQEVLADHVGQHLVRLGHPGALVRQRTAVVLTALDALVHADGRIDLDEIVRLVEPYVADPSAARDG